MEPTLQEKSRRPHTSLQRMPAEVEALVCELRRAHPRWGARRLVFELGRRSVGMVPARATVHRALVRNGLVEPRHQRHKRKYRRWQRETPCTCDRWTAWAGSTFVKQGACLTAARWYVPW